MASYAQLVSTTDATSEPVKLDKDKFTIGRKPTCDLSLAGNKLISGSHGYVERDADGRVWFNDTSTNGSLLNLVTKVNKNRVELKHGDEIHLVYRKADTAVNVAYLYQDLKLLAEEEHDQTLEYSSDADVLGDDKKVSPCAKKRQVEASVEASVDSEPVSKRHKSAADETTETAKTEVEKTEGSKAEADSATPGEGGEKTAPVVEATSSGGAKNEEMEEILICCICQELLHDCISLQPCMHGFCSGCYSEWMERSSECPSCRMTVERINKNHMVNNLVEAYLKQHPEKKRPDEDIKELDAKNKITRDMLYPGKTRGSDDDDDDEDDGSGSDGSVPDSDEEHTDVNDGGIYSVCRRRLLRDAGLLPPEVLGETSGAGEGSSRDVAGPSTRVLAGVDVDEDEGDFVPICDAVQNGRLNCNRQDTNGSDVESNEEDYISVSDWAKRFGRERIADEEGGHCSYAAPDSDDTIPIGDDSDEDSSMSSDEAVASMIYTVTHLMSSEDRQRMLRDAGFNNLSVEPADLDEEGQEGAGEGGRDLPNAVVEEEDEAEVDNAPERERARAGRLRKNRRDAAKGRPAAREAPERGASGSNENQESRAGEGPVVEGQKQELRRSTRARQEPQRLLNEMSK